MVNIAKEKKGDALVVRLSGSIEETVNFEQLIGPTPKALHVFCQEISRINSVGVKGWIKYFQACAAAGVAVTFEECSIAIVEQMNLISNFLGGGKVVSVFVPFACSKCKTESTSLFRTEDVIKVKGNVPDMKCPKCSGPAPFDDLPEEYFSFLKI